MNLGKLFNLSAVHSFLYKKFKLLEIMWGLGIKLLPIRLYNFKIKHFIKLYRSVEKTATKGDDFVSS